MPQNFILVEPDARGNIVPSILSNFFAPLYITGLTQEAIEEVQGDGAAGGTLLHYIEVPAGNICFLTQMLVYSLTAPSLIVLATSDVNTPGDPSEVQIACYDGQQIFARNESLPVLVVNNSNGTSDKYIIVYAPQNRAGVGTNNANTQYWCGYVNYVLQ